MRPRGIMLIAALCLLALAVPARGSTGPLAGGLENPESAVWDAAGERWLVSSMGGYTLGTSDRDGNGFISSVGDGPLASPFITGLNAPKGMQLHDNVLYVADIDTVLAFDATTGAELWRSVTSAEFLNDPAVDPATGDVYVTDTFGNAIYRIAAGTRAASVFLHDPALEAPNGLLVHGDTLIVASFGPDLDPNTFQTSAPGRVSTVDLATRVLTPVSGRLGNLDGIVVDDGDLLVSDFFAGRLLRVFADGHAHVEAQVAPAAADIGIDPVSGEVAVPQMAENVLLILH